MGPVGDFLDIYILKSTLLETNMAMENRYLLIVDTSSFLVAVPCDHISFPGCW